MSGDGSLLIVGRHPVPLDDAREIVETYTHPLPERPRRKDFYAWPYYDHYVSDSNPNELNDGDLLAPVLLNVDPGIHGFASLQQLRPRLTELLQDVPQGLSLESSDATPDVLDRVARLFSVLDETRPLGVSGTTLSKVLHRKRPELVPLHDRFVNQTYVPDPITASTDRSWEAYIRLLLSAMQQDLRRNEPGWDEVVRVAPSPGLTRLRTLDIIAWTIGREGTPRT